MTTNSLALSGIVCRPPRKKVSPSGIQHCQFLLEHRSVQQEVGFSRKAWCLVPVVVSGIKSPRITLGAYITVHGFISSHQARSGLSKIVLHAKQIDFNDSGD